ncbi:MAG: hypothetical protein LBT31_00775 [Synergistaceae bacterium]|jgi:hypothetical protein|nr:hypothetical protein [Synergistaceae bacterium]
MTFKPQISYQRILFWIGSTLCYWWLIYAASLMTRVKAFLAVGIIAQIADSKPLSAIRENLNTLEIEAWQTMISAGPIPDELMAVPVAIAFVLFILPFVVRLDYRAPFRGIFFLSVSVLFCYVCVSILNVVLAAGMGWALAFNAGHNPSADILVFLAYPLYVLAPQLMKNVPGALSQFLYVGFIYSVFTMPNRIVEAVETPPETRINANDGQPEDDWDKSASTMEMERATKFLETMAVAPELVSEIRTELSNYINRSAFIHEDLKTGTPHYNVILTQATGFLRRIIVDDAARQDARDALALIADEMLRMEYISPAEREKTRTWLSVLAPRE